MGRRAWCRPARAPISTSWSAIQFEGAPRFHTSWKTIERNLDRIGPKRVMLTHMAEPMLARRGEVSDPRVLLADDGLVLEV